MKVLLSPHNDDETLFAAFTCLREKPHVINCLRCDFGGRHAVRELESAKAAAVLGVTREQWDISEMNPDWDEMLHRFHALKALGYLAAWIPRVERIGGHPQHNRVGELALTVWPDATRYCTYNFSGKTRGVEVPFHPEWVGLKLHALACYQSQSSNSSAYKHFIRDQREYTAE